MHLNPRLTRGLMLALGLLVGAGAAAAAPAPVGATTTTIAPEDVRIEQSRGVDQSVDYAGLTKYGPWDDRNYELTAEDIALLPKHDQYLRRVPAFFKVLKRKEYAAEGTPLIDVYPREIHFEFYYRYGGLMQNGQVQLTSLGQYYYPDQENPRFPPGTRIATMPMAAPIEGEGPLAIGNNETSVEANPVNPQIVIAGSNGGGGQNQNYSTDGGVTWQSGGVLPQTCCDPAMEWSVDGTVAYSATLGTVGGGLRATVFRSTNNGMTWGDRRDVSTGGSDKEFIHVDHSPSSPFNDNVYLTWHQGNTMFFSRSEDRALTWSTPVSFPQHPRGIGSDITTDTQGNIYYFYPTLNRTPVQAILMLKSTDAGVTWQPPVVVSTLSGRFDFAIPSMESRRAFIYAAADVDKNTNRIWVTWTDNTPASAGPNGSPASNVGWIRVASSIDGGVTWQMAATPHADPLPPGPNAVDRYHPWLDVDDNGVVHLGFYDTRHSPNRTGVDFYYVASADNGVTWTEETRVSAATSQNITNGQEWGDYNGLSVNGPLSNVVMTWTDNRIVGAGPQQRSYAGRVTNVLGEPSFILGVNGDTSFGVCAGDSLPNVGITVGSVQGFNSPVTLSLPGLNGAVFTGGTFSPNPVTPAQPPATSTLSGLNVLGAADAGTYAVTVRGTAGALTSNATLNVTVYEDAPAATTLTAPANNASGVSTGVTFTWTANAAADAYEIEIATDPAFSNIVDSEIVEGTSYTGAPLQAAQTYYWRVRAVNPCGDGAWSTVFSFTTGTELCRTPNLAIPDGVAAGANDDFVIAQGGTIDDLQVRVRINHTYVGDIGVSLTKVGGPGPVALIDRPGYTGSGFGCSGDNIDATLSDDATQPVETQCNPSPPAISGDVRPNSPLSAFAGQTLAGTWRLNVSDSAGSDTGTLLEWCLIPIGGEPTGSANLALTLTADPTSVPAGESVDFTAQVSNAGPDAATGVSFELQLPPEMSYDGIASGETDKAAHAARGGDWSCAEVAGTVTCDLAGSLANGASAPALVVQASVAGAAAPGEVTVTGSVESNENDPVPANNTVSVDVDVTANLDIIFQHDFECTDALPECDTGAKPGVYTDREEFMALVAPGYLAPVFSQTGQIATPLNFSNPGFAISMVTDPVGGALWGEPGGIITPGAAADAIRINFTGGPVTAVGMNVWGTDINVVPISANITITLSDGTVETYTTSSQTFRGFITEAPITSIVIDGSSASPPTWTTISQLVVGAAN